MSVTNYSFPKNLQELREQLPALLKILEEGYEDRWYAFVTVEDLEQKAVRASVTEDASVSRDRGVVMRIVANACNYEVASNILDIDHLCQKAEELKAQVLMNTENQDVSHLYEPVSWKDEDRSTLDDLILEQFSTELTPQSEVHFGTPCEKSPDETSLSWMGDEARRLKNILQNKVGDTANMVGVLNRQKVKTKIFVDREKNMSQSLVTSLSYAYAVSPKGMTARSIKGAKAGFEAAMLDDAVLSELALMPAKLDAAENLKPGRYRLITGPDVTGVIAHEAFGHTQEGDTCRYGRSCASELRHRNEPVGNEQASIVNNAGVFSMGKHNHGQNGSHYFDDEGQLAREHVILDKGYLQTPMNDLLSAIVGDINGKSPRQSNGKRESWRNPIMARQTNTYFTAGDKTLEEMIGMVDDGFLAEHAYGGMEDPKGMGLTAGTEYLEEIKDGKLTGRIFLGPKGGHIELSDPVPLLLNSILAKSKVDDDFLGDLEEQAVPYNKWGGCGKYHKESVEAGSGGPWILWQGINCG